MLLSICIPTFNRLNCLDNCLNSILIASKNSNFNFEVCVSDNFSEGEVEKIINNYKGKLNINFSKNKKNLGHGKNFLKSVSMAKGDFVWTLGNDDLLLPNTLKKLYEIITEEASLKGNEIIYDLYCGTGTIGIYLSGKAKKYLVLR